MIDVVPHPVGIRILAPLEEIAVGHVRAVGDPDLALQRRVDDRDASLRHHRVPAKNRRHVDDGDIRAASSEFQGRRQAGDSRADDDDARASLVRTRFRVRVF